MAREIAGNCDESPTNNAPLATTHPTKQGCGSLECSRSELTGTTAPSGREERDSAVDATRLCRGFTPPCAGELGASARTRKESSAYYLSTGRRGMRKPNRLADPEVARRDAGGGSVAERAVG